MAFKKINGQGPDIKGFWNRVGSFTGLLVGNRKDKDGKPWFLLQVEETGTEPLIANDKNEGEVVCHRNDVIGISGSNNVMCLLDLPRGTPVRLTSHGKTTNEKTGREFWSIDVEADTERTEKLPF